MATRSKSVKAKNPKRSADKAKRRNGHTSWPVITVSLNVCEDPPVTCEPQIFQITEPFDTVIWVRSDKAGFSFRALDFLSRVPAGTFGMTCVQPEVITLDADGEDGIKYEYRITVEKDGQYYSSQKMKGMRVLNGSPVIRNK
jgi:hypothetical protein